MWGARFSLVMSSPVRTRSMSCVRPELKTGSERYSRPPEESQENQSGRFPQMECAVRRFRDTPRRVVTVAVFDLPFDSRATRAVEQRVVESARKEDRHQVFEH